MSRVFVYFNLHKQMYSVRDKKTRRVIDHKKELWLENCNFKVSEAGRQRVLKEKRKNVHAGIEGTIIQKPPCVKSSSVIFFADRDNMTFTGYKNGFVTYNPYQSPFFFDKDTDEYVHSAKYVYLSTIPYLQTKISKAKPTKKLPPIKVVNKPFVQYGA